MRALAIVVACCLAGSAESAAQAPADSGARVRISYANGPRLIGTLHAMTADSVRIVPEIGNAVLSFARRDITTLEVSTARRRRFWRHLAIAVGVAGGTGATIAAATWEPCVSTEFLGCMLYPESRGEAFTMGLLVGVGLGAPVGVLIGALVKVDDWAPVSQGPGGKRRTSLRPTAGSRPGLAVSVAFGGP